MSFQNTRKFDVIARGDLAKRIDEQQLPEGVLVADDLKSLPRQIKGLDYLALYAPTFGVSVRSPPGRPSGPRPASAPGPPG